MSSLNDSLSANKITGNSSQKISFETPPLFFQEKRFESSSVRASLWDVKREGAHLAHNTGRQGRGEECRFKMLIYCFGVVCAAGMKPSFVL